MARKRALCCLLAVLVLAGALRAIGARAPHPIHRDGLQYVSMARAAAAGAWESVLGHDYTPGYPVAAAALAWLAAPQRVARAQAPPLDPHGKFVPLGSEPDAPFIAGALCASLLFGSLVVLPAFALGCQLGGCAGGLWAALLGALQPYHALYSGYVLTEATFSFWLLAALAALAFALGAEGPARALGRAGLAGVLCGLAYLVRPEVLAVLLGALPLLVLHRRRGTLLAGLVLPAALAAVPVLWGLNRSGRWEGFRISGKGDPLHMLRELLQAPAEVGANVLGNLAALGEYGHPLYLLLVLAGAVVLWRQPHRAARRVAVLLGSTALVYLLAASIVRVEKRFALQIGLVLLPLGGLGLAWLHGRLAARWGAARAGAALVLLLGAATVPVLLHKSRPQRGALLEAAAQLQAQARALGIERPGVVCRDARLAYYAQARAVAPVQPGGALQPAAAAAALRAGQAQLVALEQGRDPSPQALQALLPSVRLEPLAAGAAPGPAGPGRYVLLRARPAR